MKKTLAAVVVLFASFFGTSALAECVTPPNVNEMATEIAAGLNQSRRANGEAPLRFSRELGRAASVQEQPDDGRDLRFALR